MVERVANGRRDGIAVIALGGFRAPELPAATRAALDHALTATEGAEAVILSLGGLWRDLTPVTRPDRAAPDLRAIATRIEASPVPVVAVLSGPILGAAFDLALAAHYRIGDAKLRLGFPEVLAGRLPEGGGSQRLPRLLGADRALDMLVAGKTMAAETARSLGLLDDHVTGDLEAAAMVFARGLLSEGIGPRPTSARRDGFADPVEYELAISDRRATGTSGPNPVPARAIEAVEGALLLPFAAGLALEESLNDDLDRDDAARALAYMARAERKVADLPERGAGQARGIAAIGILGGGTMGASLAAEALRTGLPVVVVEREQGLMQATEARVRGIFARAVERGTMTAQDAQMRADLLVPTTALDGLADVDLVIEAVNEPYDRKARVLTQIGALVRSGVPVCLTSAQADIADLAQVYRRPSDVVGLHFAAPAHLARLAEICVAPDSSPDAVMTAVTFARRLGKIAVRSGPVPGRIGGSVLAALIHAADDMVGRGARPSQIDAAFVGWGMRMGPFQMMDLAGLDTPLLRAIRQPETRMAEEAPRAVAELVWEAMLERGWAGASRGKGYLKPGELADEPAVLSLFADARTQAGVPGREFSPTEIRRRGLAAMVNAGARLVETGAALRPSDVDVVAVHAHGLPRWRGGPMMAADLRGLVAVRKDMVAFAPDSPSLYAPVGLIEDLIKNGQRFADLSAV